ncbi:uncharacterized protein LTR77_003664 [Saxophila tyrrhenica]|uniref:Uncharacterized protein n=1 Tax=Saxophila tyrrhenica TaxID=1690608 RepID=A0AAV9PFL4_9PEZI|nr:hypothetical protein LTR77_003664 [Saxophila tyrrhenica]
MGTERQETEGLDELVAPAPDENPQENEYYRHDSLESERRTQDIENRVASIDENARPASKAPSFEKRFLAKFYTVSYLIFFSILGTLARLGLVALTAYPGGPNANPILWANVGGSLIIGFLREDRLLFRNHWKQATQDARDGAQEESRHSVDDRNEGGDGGGRSGSDESELEKVAQQSFNEKKTRLHVYIGLAVGFCGSFTSFADIIRDAFLAISDDFSTADITTLETTDVKRGRSDGYSVLAVIGILWLQVAMSTASLQLGAHIATGVGSLAEIIPVLELKIEEVLNKVVLVLGCGSWIGAVMMAIWPPQQAWRGQAVFAIVFAPVGCLLRFYLALLLNPRANSFPLGTFAANVFGTCVLGMAWDLQHSRLVGVVGCQVLQGIGDGFCGALTTVSTWVLELKALKLWHSYVYAAASIGVSLAFMVVIMGSFRWTEGFQDPVC